MIAFILGFWVAVAGAQSPSDSAFTSASTLSQSAFPRSEMVRRYQVPTSAEQRRLDELRELVAEQVRSLPHHWSKGVTGRELNPGERERLLDSFLGVPIYFCRGEKCGGCSQGEGCFLFKRLVGGLGSALILSSHYRGSAGSEALLSTLYWSLAQLLHEMSGAGETFMTREDRSRIRSTVEELVDATHTRLQMRNRCPGPFLESDRSFLEKQGILTPLNDFWEQCGAELMVPVRRLESVPECARLLDLKKWAQIKKDGWFSGTVVFRRCEAACETATCGNSKNPAPRFIPLARSAVVSLPPSVCEGAHAQEPLRLAQQILGSYLKPTVRRSPALSAELKLCLAKLSPAKRTVSPGEQTAPPVPAESGIELNLIE